MFAEADDDAVILMAKWDIQDGFLAAQLPQRRRVEFCYVWPRAPTELCRLVAPSSLQMGWVDSAPYSCAASDTARDIAVNSSEKKIGTLPKHKFEHWAGMETALVNDGQQNDKLHYVLDVYVDAVILCIVPTKKATGQACCTNKPTNKPTNEPTKTNQQTNQ